MPQVSSSEWNDFLSQHPHAHLLQTAAWGDLKADFGWQPVRLIAGEAGAQMLFRSLPLGYTIAYIPKGPLGSHWEALWPEVQVLCRTRKTVFLKIETDTWEYNSAPPLAEDFRPSPHAIQPRRTILLDLTSTEEDILARMKQKTRYNIRLAAKKDVSIHSSANIEVFSSLMQTTGQRDGFGVHSLDYYRRAYQLFHPSGACEIFVAEYDNQPLAALMIFVHGQRAWYLYGASNNQHRNRMPTYLLQWEAIRWARTQGCKEYDLWGVPDADQDALEAEFMQRDDGLWGVYRFKRGFGGQLNRAAAPMDQVYHPTLYALYKLYSGKQRT